MDNMHMKRCSSPLVIREMQTKITMTYHYMPTRMVKMKKRKRKKESNGQHQSLQRCHAIRTHCTVHGKVS